VRNDDHGPTIAVADRGSGIPLEERKHVFKRFYRIERSRSSPGNGLGLSLVSSVAQLHGAHIEMGDNGPGLKIQLQFRPRTARRATQRGRSHDTAPRRAGDPPRCAASWESRPAATMRAQA
jgi:signal transduction histidine kinase